MRGKKREVVWKRRENKAAEEKENAWERKYVRRKKLSVLNVVGNNDVWVEGNTVLRIEGKKGKILKGK